MNHPIELTAPTDAVDVARAELSVLVDTVHGLAPDDFALPTDCVGWTVRDVVAHLTGAADEAVHRTVQVRHMLAAKTTLRKMPLVDALTHQQVAERAKRSDADVVAELADLAPRVPAARAAVPRFLRNRGFPDPGALPGDTLGYLLDVIYTRDVWMHRIDISRATSAPMPDSGVEDVVVGQVVRDLQRGWSGSPFTLVLTGRVAGSWLIGADEPTQTVTVDCVALCRMLSGRSDETALTDPGPDGSVRPTLGCHRIVF